MKMLDKINEMESGTEIEKLTSQFLNILYKNKPDALITVVALSDILIGFL